MTRVLFIHGTMTRYGERYTRTFGIIERRLRDWRGRAEVAKFPWGDYWGAEQNPAFVSIPGADEREAPLLLGADAEGQEPASEAERWAMLYADPLAELRQLLSGQDGAEGAPQTPASRELRRAARRLAEAPPGEALAALLAVGGIEATFQPAAAQVVNLFQQGELRLRLQTLPEARRAAVRLALARATVAAALVAAHQGADYPEALLDAGLRGQIVAEVERALGGGVVLGGAPDLLSFLPATAATRLLLRPLRVTLTRALLLFLGDILVYQARGRKIRAAIAEHLGDGPTVLLAHSLGGIACAELLLTDRAARRKVPLLVTVGTQAGMLDEIGALAATKKRRADAFPLPAGFPPWLNICDRNDMLSFRVAPRFSGLVRDVELDSANPFPHAHNAYWRNDRVWEHILTALGDPAKIQLQLR